MRHYSPFHWSHGAHFPSSLIFLSLFLLPTDLMEPIFCFLLISWSLFPPLHWSLELIQLSTDLPIDLMWSLNPPPSDLMELISRSRNYDPTREHRNSCDSTRGKLWISVHSINFVILQWRTLGTFHFNLNLRVGWIGGVQAINICTDVTGEKKTAKCYKPWLQYLCSKILITILITPIKRSVSSAWNLWIQAQLLLL